MNIKKYIIAIIATLTTWTAATAEDMEDDIDIELAKLAKEIRHERDDEARKVLLVKMCKTHYHADSTYKYSMELLKLSRKLEDRKTQLVAFQCLHWATFYNNDFPSTLKWAYQQIVLADSLGDTKMQARGLMAMGNGYSMMQNEVKADELYQKALMKFIEARDTSGMCITLNNIAQSDCNNDMYDKAEECYTRMMEIAQACKNDEYLSDCHWGKGYTALQRYKSDEIVRKRPELLKNAKGELWTAYELAKKIESEYSTERAAFGLASTYLSESDLYAKGSKEWSLCMDSCKYMVDLGTKLTKRASNQSDQLDCDIVRFSYLIKTDKLRDAKVILDSLSMMMIKDTINYRIYLKDIYEGYSEIYEKEGNLKQALRNKDLSKYWALKGRSKEYAATTMHSMAQTEFEMKLKAHERKSAEREKAAEEREERQNIIIIVGLILMVIILVATGWVVRLNVKRKKAYQLLDAKNVELEEQREEIISQNENLEEKNEQIEMQRKNLVEQNKVISESNRQIKESLNYARLIQMAAMPTEAQLSGIFGDHMIVFRPLNIVSGDFMWATEADGIKMLAIADCTGHGVPGAFLSMLGISILNEIAAKTDLKKITAGEMLDTMRLQLEMALHQRVEDENGNHDGMDMALIKIDSDKKVLHFAGAFRPLIIVQDGEMKKIDGDRMPIGIHYREMEHFTDHEIELNSGDVIYMFTDGMTDQFGYDDKNNIHKFTSKRLRNLLSNIYRLPFSTQQVKIEMTFDAWRAEGLQAIGELYEQTDDALIVGLRV